jgi:hypothetical protein
VGEGGILVAFARLLVANKLRDHTVRDVVKAMIRTLFG